MENNGGYEDLKKEDMTIPGQIGLFEFLAENSEKMPDKPVEIKGVVDLKRFSDFSIQSTYRDIFLIINMLDDYVVMLKKPEMHRNHYTDYMISQFERISAELSGQIGLDKEKMYKKCQGRIREQDSVGEDAMVLSAKGKNLL